MNKWIPVLVLAVMAGVLFYISLRQNSVSLVLAAETHKAMSAMMVDLRQARASTIEGVPADGKWYHSVAFEKAKEGIVRYEVTPAGRELRRISTGANRTVARSMEGLNIRRQLGVVDVLEVQLQAKNRAELVSNFKIRTRD